MTTPPLSGPLLLGLTVTLLGATAFLSPARATLLDDHGGPLASPQRSPLLESFTVGELSASTEASTSTRYELPLWAGERVSFNVWFSIKADEEHTSQPPIAMLRLVVISPDGRVSASPLCSTGRPEDRRYDVLVACRLWSFTAGAAGRYTVLMEDRTVLRRTIAWWMLTRRDFPKASPAAR